MDEKPAKRKCSRCGVEFWDDGCTLCPRCDELAVTDDVARLPPGACLPEAARNVRDLRDRQQKRIEMAAQADYFTFLVLVIEKGIEAARKDYSSPDQAHKLAGSIVGFDACRGQRPEAIKELLVDAQRRVLDAHGHPDDVYWMEVCRRAEIEWTANVMSAALMASGSFPIIPPTCRGVLQADKIFRELAESKNGG